uniref:Uncharacterized protein n=1 Tax=Tetraselmis sp. GSL018 TaxID=582737 RepID=A0A061RYE5_9CHLO
MIRLDESGSFEASRSPRATPASPTLPPNATALKAPPSPPLLPAPSPLGLPVFLFRFELPTPSAQE